VYLKIHTKRSEVFTGSLLNHQLTAIDGMM